MTDAERMQELKGQGFFCSQIILQLALDLQGKDNPDLVAAMHGLAGGLGFVGETCGALTGGACVLGLYAGRARPEDDDDPRLSFMITDLVQWFKNGYGQEYGGLRCADILQGIPNAQAARCPRMVQGTLQKVKELLVANGYDLAGSDVEA